MKHLTGLFLCFFLLATFAVSQAEVILAPINHLLLSEKFTVSSSSFTDGEALDIKYTLYGSNISPQLSWENPPAGTESFFIIVMDADSDPANFVHWIVEVPKTVFSLNENAGQSGGANLPDGSDRFDNDFIGSGIADGTDYDGPRPPAGSGIHRYIYAVAAINSSDDIIRMAYLVGTYNQPL